MLFLGVLFAFGSALGESTTDLFRKKTVSTFDSLTASFALNAFTFLIALPVTLLIACGIVQLPPFLHILNHVFPISAAFWLPLAGSVLLNSFAVYLVMDALSKADIGMVVPLSTLSPVFLLVTAPIISGEYASWFGVVGIIITTIGVWGLKFKKDQKNFLSPFAALWKDGSSRKMLLVALIWAISAPFDKRASVAGGPLWYMMFLNLGLALVYAPFLFYKDRIKQLCSSRIFQFIPLGVSNAFRAFCQFTALSLILTPYAIGIKRLSILFGILWGHIFFHERDTRQRLIAASIMIAGSILILVASVT